MLTLAIFKKKTAQGVTVSENVARDMIKRAG